MTMPEQEVEFNGRKIWARMPSPEQLLVWRRTLNRLQGLDAQTSWTADTVMVELERLRKIVDSLMVNKSDVVWVDDQFLEGALTFKGLMPFIQTTLDAFSAAAEAEGNRETRRAAAKKTPAKKATRKKAAPSAR